MFGPKNLDRNLEPKHMEPACACCGSEDGHGGERCSDQAIYTTQAELNSKINTAHAAGQFQSLGNVIAYLQGLKVHDPRDFTRENLRDSILSHVQRMMAEVL